ncbi:MAG: leucine--tRNA ligase [archaeon]
MADFNKIARKWQKRWDEKKIFEPKESSKKKFYTLEMYPYPSSHGLHVGHARNYIIGDIYSRFKRMNGFNVLYPMGYDSFGLPAENAAIKAKSHPKIFTEAAIKNFMKQQKYLGLSYDWTRTLASHSKEYYKWDQWIFLKLLEKGLAYKKKSLVNWCPKCNTVLANEQVNQGKCWRHTDTEVDPKELSQWFIKTTAYSEKLLKGLDKLKDWPEDVKTMQRNWIGKSHGVEIFFKLEGSGKVLPTFTTRADTIYSVTFIVIAPENPLAKELVAGTKHEAEFEKVLKKISKQSIIERTTPEGKDKLGCFLGKYALNPVNGEKVPIYIANFVLPDYGSGIVMADAHDQRDFEFARKYKIPLKFVISDDGEPINADKATRAFTANGILFNSGEFSGMHNMDALPDMNNWLEKKGMSKKTVNYKLKDWLISRQRYWGCPIPIIYCDKCGIVPVPEKDLPVKLPKDVTFGGKGNPLETSKSFQNVKCPLCGDPARRETDTMDTFMDSSWYFLRYCDAKNDKKIFDSKKVNYWLPVDLYIGGKEHATMHLIYFRFLTKFFKDIGLVNFDEPATRLYNQGMLHKGGFVMSKSRGNVITPEEVGEKYGVDTLRTFLVFIAGPDKDMEWSDEGVAGSFRFVNKLYNLYFDKIASKNSTKDKQVMSKLNKMIQDVTEKTESLRYNLALIDIMELVNYLHKYRANISTKVYKEALQKTALLIAPYCPHVAEEFWEKLGKKGFISLEKWPSFDSKKIDDKAECEEGFTDNVRKDIISVLKLTGISKPKKITLFVAAKWKYSFMKEFKKLISSTRNPSEIIKAMMKGELKQHGKDVANLVPKLIKDSSKVPGVVLEQKAELSVLENEKANLEKEFGCSFEIVKAEDSSENKAMNAMPGKAAILVE